LFRIFGELEAGVRRGGFCGAGELDLVFDSHNIAEFRGFERLGREMIRFMVVHAVLSSFGSSGFNAKLIVLVDGCLLGHFFCLLDWDFFLNRK